jgi:hypothetical protein
MEETDQNALSNACKVLLYSVSVKPLRSKRNPLHSRSEHSSVLDDRWRFEPGMVVAVVAADSSIQIVLLVVIQVQSHPSIRFHHYYADALRFYYLSTSNTTPSPLVAAATTFYTRSAAFGLHPAP